MEFDIKKFIEFVNERPRMYQGFSREGAEVKIKLESIKDDVFQEHSNVKKYTGKAWHYPFDCHTMDPGSDKHVNWFDMKEGSDVISFEEDNYVSYVYLRLKVSPKFTILTMLGVRSGEFDAVIGSLQLIDK